MRINKIDSLTFRIVGMTCFAAALGGVDERWFPRSTPLGISEFVWCIIPLGLIGLIQYKMITSFFAENKIDV